MKLRSIMTSATIAVTAFLAVPHSAEPIAVYDAANHVENILQVANQVEQLISMAEREAMMVRNLSKMEIRSWRDLRSFIAQIEAVMQYGNAIAYTSDNVVTSFVNHMPFHRSVNPDHIPGGEDMFSIHRLWRRVTRDSFAGALALANRHVQDWEEIHDTLQELEVAIDGADGNVRQLEGIGMMSKLQVQETQKLNSLMGALINVQSMQYGVQAARRAMVEATMENMLFPPGWDAYVNVESYPVFDPTPGL